MLISPPPPHPLDDPGAHTPPFSCVSQGWLDLPKEDESALASTGVVAEKWVRHWFVLRNTVLNMYTEEQARRAAPRRATPRHATPRRRLHPLHPSAPLPPPSHPRSRPCSRPCFRPC